MCWVACMRLDRRCAELVAGARLGRDAGEIRDCLDLLDCPAACTGAHLADVLVIINYKLS